MKIYCLITTILLLTVSCIDKSYVNTPEVVGTPPQNAYTGLVKLDNGELRHYGDKMYIRSTDDGENWDSVFVSDGNFYGKKNPQTGEYLRVYAGNDDRVFSLRSEGGIDGKWIKTLSDSNGAIMIKPVVFVRGGTRSIAAFHTKHRNGCGVYYSDDSGKTWDKSNQVNTPPHKVEGFHKGQRWNHGAVEPSVVELKDGRLWMLIRNAQDNLYESFSEDYGETWSTPIASRFYGTITMPTIQRLNNGSLLLIWCNTTPLPELDHDGGYWEDVFTNRDAIHGAISDDDGKTWKGFREIYLNPLRNDSLMATRFGKMGSNDRSVQQSEIIELGESKVLIALGQHPKFRKLLKLDLNWLYEKERVDDFSSGLVNWSYHKYLKGIKGHCAYNRKPGAFQIQHPENPTSNVMHLKAERDTSLLAQNSGALFNFPAGRKGSLKVRIRLNKGFKGISMSLHDRWFSPIDTVGQYHSMFNLKIAEGDLLAEAWHNLRFEWESTENEQRGYCRVFINDKIYVDRLPLNNMSINGISYIHFLLPSTENSNEGILIESIKAEGLEGWD